MGKRWKSMALVVGMLGSLPLVAGAGQGAGKQNCTRHISSLGVTTEVCSENPAPTHASQTAVEKVNASVPEQAIRNPLLEPADSGEPMPPRETLP